MEDRVEAPGFGRFIDDGREERSREVAGELEEEETGEIATEGMFVEATMWVPGAILVEAVGGEDAVEVGFIAHTDTVAVEDDHGAEAQSTALALELEGTVGGSEEAVDEEFWVEPPSGNEGLGTGEDEMVVRNRQEVAVDALSPLELNRGGAFGATTLVTGVVEDDLGTTGRAGENGAAELRSTADGDALEDGLASAVERWQTGRGICEEQIGQIGVTHAVKDGRETTGDSNGTGNPGLCGGITVS